MNEERNGTIGVDNVLYRLYQEATGYAPESMMLLPGAGSGRKYYRMRGVESLIGVVGTTFRKTGPLWNFHVIFASKAFRCRRCVA